MMTDGFKEKIFRYVFENAGDGYLFFDGDVVSKELQIPANMVMDIMDIFENNGFFERIQMAQRKSQVTIKYAGYEAYDKYKQQSGSPQAPVQPQNTTDIFISHSSKDEKLTQALIDLLVKAFHLTSKQIRCTTIPAYKLEIGADTTSTLKAQIFSSKLFIGVLTEHSLRSTYVLFELGARWSTDKPLLPLICDRREASLLESPLDSINALMATKEAELHQFIEDVGNYLGIQSDVPSSYYRELKLVNSLALASDVLELPARSTSRSL